MKKRSEKERFEKKRNQRGKLIFRKKRKNVETGRINSDILRIYNMPSANNDHDASTMLKS